MQLPRFRIRTLMIAVAISAAASWGYTHPFSALIAAAFVPWAAVTVLCRMVQASNRTTRRIVRTAIIGCLCQATAVVAFTLCLEYPPQASNPTFLFTGIIIVITIYNYIFALVVLLAWAVWMNGKPWAAWVNDKRRGRQPVMTRSGGWGERARSRPLQPCVEDSDP
jgi:hypothetical protein